MKLLDSNIEIRALEATTTLEEIKAICATAIEQDFVSISVPPMFVKNAKSFICEHPIEIATVVGFPLGYQAIESKLAEVVLAMVDGADEIQVVINVLALKNNDWQYLAKELNTLLSVIRSKSKRITLIIEVAALNKEELIQCCDLYGAAGIDFLQAGTGFYHKAITPEMIRTIRKHLADNVKIKLVLKHDQATQAQDFIQAGAAMISIESSLQFVKQSLDPLNGTIFEP